MDVRRAPGDELSDRFAARVQGAGAEPAILGVLKAGCGYLPLDPLYPRKRLTFMLDDAEVELVGARAPDRRSCSPTKARFLRRGEEGAHD